MTEQTDPFITLYSTPEMSATFSPREHVRCMLLFEMTLAQAEARLGIIPQSAVQAIVDACDITTFDITTLYHEATSAGTPAIPLVRMLTDHVTGDAKKYVHWGATSQDAIDTALMLQIRTGINHLLTDLLAIGSACAKLAERYRQTPMVGRTLLQQALPITFGLKAARWLALITRQIQALQAQREHSLALQLGGAAGTLASLGLQGPQVIATLAEELQLPAPDLPWHTERDRIANVASALGILAGAMAKIASDIALLMQSEVNEVAEGSEPGKGGSSAMPHKHNPVDTTRASAASRMAIGTVPVILSAMVQEQERAVGGWQAEWEAMPNLFRFTACTVKSVRSAITGLHIDPEQMRANLALHGGLNMAEALMMALAPHIGRPEAYRLVQAISKRTQEMRHALHATALADEQIRAILSPEEIHRALDPTMYTGSSNMFIDRALASFHTIQSACT